MHTVAAHHGQDKAEYLLCFRHNTRAHPIIIQPLCEDFTELHLQSRDRAQQQEVVSPQPCKRVRGFRAGSSPGPPTPGQTLRPQCLSRGMDPRLWQPMKESPLLQSLPQFLSVLPHFPRAGMTSICHHTWLFAWVLGFELRTSYLSQLSSF